MSPDATKKQPTTETSELQEFELEYQIRLRAYQLYEARGRKDGSRARRLVPRERGDHDQEIPHRLRLICAHTPSQKVRQAPDRSGAFSCAGESHTQSTHVPCQIPNSQIRAERSIIEAHGRIRRSPAYHSKAWQSQLGPSHAARSSRRYRVRSGGQAITPNSGTVRRLGGA